MRLLVVIALLLQGTAGMAWATAYYVSETATNGYVVGNDSNDGLTKGAAKLTVSNAISTSSTGDTITVNDGTYAGTELGASGYAIIAKGITITAETTGQVIFRTTASTGVVRFQGPVGVTQGLTGIVLDGTNSSTVPTQTVLIEDALGLYTVNLTNVAINGATTYLINMTGREVALTLTDITFESGGTNNTRSLLDAITLDEGGVTIDGAVGAISNQNNASKPMINVKATTAGVTASISGVEATITLDSSLTSTGVHGGIVLTNIASAVIEDCDITINGQVASRSGNPYQITADAAISAANGIIRNNTAYNNTRGGYLATIGADATSAGNNYTSNGQIYGNTLRGNTSATSDIHGPMLGFTRGGRVWGNTVTDAGIGLLSKQQTVSGGDGPSLFYGNLILNPLSQGLRAKGSVGTIFANNTVYWSGAGLPVDYGILIDHDGATVSDSVQVMNNVVYGMGTLPILAGVSTGNTATFATNLYYSDQALAANSWVYGASSYATLATWNAAAHAEGDLFESPGFMLAGSDFRTIGASTMRRAGTSVGTNCTDFRGRLCWTPPDIGAYQSSSGDPAGPRAARQ